MKRRTLLTAGGSALVAMGASLPQSGFFSDAAFAQSADSALPGVAEMVLGDPNAPIEVIEYASFTCSHCASFHANHYAALKANYIDTGLVRFVYRDVYFDRPGLWASMIARCSGDTASFFEFQDLLYTQQQVWLATGDPAGIIRDLRDLAKTAGMDDATLDSCLSNGPKAEALFTWYQENAERDRIEATPTFVIDGQKYSNMAYDEFAVILDEKLG